MDIFLNENLTGLQKVDSAKEVDSGFCWINATVDELDQAFNQMPNTAGFSLEALKKLFSVPQAAFMEEKENGRLVFFHDLVSSDDAEQATPLLLLQVNNVLLTVSRSARAPISVSKQKLNMSSAEDLLFKLLLQIIDDFSLLRDSMMKAYQDWRSNLLKKTRRRIQWESFLAYIAGVRQLRMMCEQQEAVLEYWSEEVDEEGELQAKIARVMQYSLRKRQYIHRLEQDLESLLNLHYAILNGRTNDIMRVLTAITAIFLPLNLITGIFGMNFQHMPLLNNVDGLLIVAIVMGTLVCSLFLFFKTKDWL